MSAVVTIVFDDGYQGVYDVAYPILKAAGIPATVAVIGGAISGNYITDHDSGENLQIKMQPKQIMELAANGWEMASHSMFHYQGMDWILANWGADASNYDCAESKRILEMLGIQSEVLVYPGGGYSQGLIDIAKNYYSCGRTIGYLTETLPVPADDTWALKPWAVLNNGTTLSKTQQGIQQAISTNGWCNLYFHAVVATAAEVPSDLNRSIYYTTKDELQQIVDYIQSLGAQIQVKSISEVMGLPYSVGTPSPSLGATDFKYWTQWANLSWPTGWSILPSKSNSLEWTNVAQESTIVDTGINSCKITATAPGEGIERVLFDKLPETLEISVYPTSGRFKLQLVDLNRNPIATSDPNDVTETTNLNQWNNLRIYVPERDPADTYFQIVSLDANSVGYVDSMSLSSGVQLSAITVSPATQGLQLVATIQNLIQGQTPTFQYSTDKQNWVDMGAPTLISGDLTSGTWQTTKSLNDYATYYFRAGVLDNGSYVYSDITTFDFVAPPAPPPLPITDVATLGVHAIGGFEVAQWDANPAGYQYPGIDTDPTALVLFDEDMNPVAILEDAQGIFIEEELNGIENLEFTLPIDSLNWPEIKGERYLHYQDREWVISTIGDKHDPSGTLLSNVQCVSNAIHELSGMRYNGQDLANLTALAGLLLLFEGTGWTIGQVDSTELRSLQANRKTVLANARDLASQHTSYLVFDTINHVVNLIKTPGKDNGVQIRIGKNLQGVDRFTDFSNMVTRLWPYGSNNLGIETVNSGISYIDNFSWYLSQGVAQAEIDADIAQKGKSSRFLKEGEWTASQYSDPQALYDDAAQQLANNCAPLVSYNFKVIDLSTLPGYEQEKYLLGDTVLALDEQLDISTAQYIVRRKWYPKQPYLDEMTLANLRTTILDTGAQTARTLLVVDQRIDSWSNASDTLSANFDAWQRAHNLNPDGTIPIDLLRGIWYAAQSAIRAGKNESVIIDDTGLTIAEHSIIEDHGEAGALGQFGFGGQFVGENPMPVVIHWKTDRYLKATGGAIAMCAGEGLPVRTAVTPDGILAPSIIITDDNPLTCGDGYTFMGTGGVQVVDNQGVVRAFLGHYQVADPANNIPDAWGLQIAAGSIDWANVNPPTAGDVGALPLGWMPTAADVGALPVGWMPTAAQVGALATDWVGTTHIDQNGMYTGTIVANQIAVGILNGFTITGADISALDTLYIAANAPAGDQTYRSGIQFGETVSGYTGPVTMQFTQGLPGDGISNVNLTVPNGMFDVNADLGIYLNDDTRVLGALTVTSQVNSNTISPYSGNYLYIGSGGCYVENQDGIWRLKTPNGAYLRVTDTGCDFIDSSGVVHALF